jgi:hypothetical protein
MSKGKILINGKVAGEVTEFLPYDPKRFENIQVLGGEVVELVPCDYSTHLHLSSCKGCNDTEHVCTTGDRVEFHSCQEHCLCARL